MRVLAVDHFFDQDLDALEAGLSPSDSLVRISYQRFHRLATDAFPATAFVGVRAAFVPGLESAWVRYRKSVSVEVRTLAAAHRPDVLVIPSDSIFYLRPVMDEFRSLGVSIFVLQKETTISPMTMEKHSVEIGEYLPFSGDKMTVCSVRHREFWLRAGADPARVHVTGQPRFDVYAQASSKRRDGGKPRLLYLSFDDVAYLPADMGIESDLTWRDLRQQVETEIASMSDVWDVTVKIHPQQTPAGDCLGPNARHADRLADTRALILDADVVLAFQTTAIFEAAVAGRPVIYPAWGKVYDEERGALTPFDEYPGLVITARSPIELRDLLAKSANELSLMVGDAKVTAEVHLGPVDGHATERAIALLRELVGRSSCPVATAAKFRGGRLLLGPAGVAARFAAHIPGIRARPFARRLRQLGERWSQMASESWTIFRSKNPC